MNNLIVLNDLPYGTERSFNKLRMAHALVRNDRQGEAIVFPMADAVLSAKGRVLVCGTSMDARGPKDEGMPEGAARSAMDELAQATLAADKVLVF